MSTLEATISMIEVLPEADLIKIQDFIKTIFEQHSSESPFPLLDEGDILKDMETSERQFVEGKYKGAKQVLNEIRKEYEL